MTPFMKEYYSNPEAVASAIQSFMDLTVDEMRNDKKVSHNMRILTSEIVETEMLDNELIGKMDYSELITMIEMSRHIKYQQMYLDRVEICTSEVFNLYNYKILFLILIGASRNSPQIRLFMELPIKQFYKYVDSISNKDGMNKKLLGDYNDFRREVERLHGKVSEDLTIKELLYKVNEKVCKNWNIVDMSVESYKQMILDELRLIRKVLALKFMEAYPEKFDTYKVKNKYSKRREGE